VFERKDEGDRVARGRALVSAVGVVGEKVSCDSGGEGRSEADGLGAASELSEELTVVLSSSGEGGGDG
jgi:hypothetical protein